MQILDHQKNPIAFHSRVWLPPTSNTKRGQRFPSQANFSKKQTRQSRFGDGEGGDDRVSGSSCFVVVVDAGFRKKRRRRSEVTRGKIIIRAERGEGGGGDETWVRLDA